MQVQDFRKNKDDVVIVFKSFQKESKPNLRRVYTIIVTYQNNRFHSFIIEWKLANNIRLLISLKNFVKLNNKLEENK